ncbi:DUF4314 domain-containing protein [Rhizobium sp. CNPSo 4062]|uniref:DUF4314 domain-containing protein n=1 Tax=Rhizobium sp. CNPSo 4062 TaxID=3021410 RepID=UPI000DDD9DC7
MTASVGDKVKLIHMPNDPNPVTRGSLGVITHISEAYPDEDVPLTYVVRWENGRTHNILVGIDEFELLN